MLPGTEELGDGITGCMENKLSIRVTDHEFHGSRLCFKAYRYQQTNENEELLRGWTIEDIEIQKCKYEVNARDIRSFTFCDLHFLSSCIDMKPFPAFG